MQRACELLRDSRHVFKNSRHDLEEIEKATSLCYAALEIMRQMRHYTDIPTYEERNLIRQIDFHLSKIGLAVVAVRVLDDRAYYLSEECLFKKPEHVFTTLIRTYALLRLSNEEEIPEAAQLYLIIARRVFTHHFDLALDFDFEEWETEDVYKFILTTSFLLKVLIKQQQWHETDKVVKALVSAINYSMAACWVEFDDLVPTHRNLSQLSIRLINACRANANYYARDYRMLQVGEDVRQNVRAALGRERVVGAKQASREEHELEKDDPNPRHTKARK